MIEELCEAINNKSIVVLRGKADRGNRTVEPHIVYEAPNKNVMVDFYQTAGYSSSGKLPAWRRLLINDILEVRVLTDPFETRIKEGYNPSNKQRYFRIICKI